MGNKWDQDDDWSDFDDDDDQGSDSGDGKKPNPMRKRMRQLEKENRELKEVKTKMEQQARQSSISKVLEAKGYSAKVASLIPEDIEPSVEALDKWLTEYGDVFAPASATSESGEGVEETDEAANQYGQSTSRMGNATSAGNSALSKDEDIQRELSREDLKHEELLKLIRDSGGGPGVG